MADQTAREPRITGEDILSEVLRNMEDGLFRIRYTTLVPSVFRVYLHDRDYEPLRAAVPLLVEETRRALNERLAEWNSRDRLSFLRRIGGSPPQTEHKILGEDWTIEFYPDMEGKLQRGDIEIYSELGEPPKPEYGVGMLTTRISRKEAGGRRTTSEVSSDSTGRSGDTVYAHLRFEDNDGPRAYAITKNQVVIGRGGKAYWVDLKLNTLPDVSREHCRIRRDPASGKFLIKDMSEFGTTVNEKRIPSSMDKEDGGQKDKNIEVPLPSPARIGLAEVIFMEFDEGGRK
jgi:hypothetical protein